MAAQKAPCDLPLQADSRIHSALPIALVRGVHCSGLSRIPLNAHSAIRPFPLKPHRRGGRAERRRCLCSGRPVAARLQRRQIRRRVCPARARSGRPHADGASGQAARWPMCMRVPPAMAVMNVTQMWACGSDFQFQNADLWYAVHSPTFAGMRARAQGAAPIPAPCWRAAHGSRRGRSVYDESFPTNVVSLS
jgi:hypothetical protein